MTFIYNPNKHDKPKGFIYEQTEPSIDTVVSDIYAYMGGHGKFPKITDEDTEDLVRILSATVIERLKERRKEIQNHNTEGKKNHFKLRLSNYGQPARKLWYEANIGTDLGATDPRAFLNFMIGDIWEAVILFLCKKTGHKVELEQATVELEGVEGHTDARIDGVLTDVKSASKFAFEKKFMGGALLEGDDPFAYVPQLRGYGQATGDIKLAWLVANKETGELGVVKLPYDPTYDAKKKMNEAKRIISLPEPPPKKCFDPIPHQKTGNMQLNPNCRFCPFKEKCWEKEGLRVFQYSTGPVYLTHVENEPKVPEITTYKGEIQ